MKTRAPGRAGSVRALLQHCAAARKLSCRTDISRESFAMAAQVLLDKWAARGCDPQVLAAIRKDVFNIDAPKK